jgi:hypothetical protein
MLGRLVVFRRAAVVGVVLYGAATFALVVGPHSALNFFLALTLIATIANLMFLAGLGWRREFATYLGSLGISALSCTATLVVRYA